MAFYISLSTLVGEVRNPWILCQDLQSWMQSFLAVSLSHVISLVLDCDRGGTKSTEVGAAGQRIEGGNRPRRCTLVPHLFILCLRHYLTNPPPPMTLFFATCREGSLKCTQCQIARQSQTAQKQTVSSKLTRLGGGLLLFLCFFCEHKVLTVSI